MGKSIEDLINESKKSTEALIAEEHRMSRQLNKEFIAEEHRISRLQMAEFHRYHQEWVAQTNQQIALIREQGDRHHKENMLMLARFQDILDRIIKPGEN